MSDVREVRHSEVWVSLVEEDGNAFAILGRARQAMKRAGVPDEEVQRFVREATGGDHDELLATVLRWVNVEGEIDD